VSADHGFLPRPAAALILALFAVSVASGQEPPRQRDGSAPRRREVRSDKEGFSVMMPGEPKVGTRPPFKLTRHMRGAVYGYSGRIVDSEYGGHTTRVRMLAVGRRLWQVSYTADRRLPRHLRVPALSRGRGLPRGLG
jgi:hypothetical protein